MQRLNFQVRVHGDGYLTEAMWAAIARRIAKAAKGRAEYRSVTVFAGDSCVSINEIGDVKEEHGTVKPTQPHGVHPTHGPGYIVKL